MESKLQLLAGTLASQALKAKGERREVYIEVMRWVTWLMGENVPLPREEDPVFWFDKRGRFCTRAMSKEEIEDSMWLMGIVEGVPLDVVCRMDSEFFDRADKWSVFQEMKCKYLEGLMRIQELEEELQAVKLQQAHTAKSRFADVDHLKQLILMAMDLAKIDTLTKDELIFCLDKAPSWEVDINTEIAEKEET